VKVLVGLLSLCFSTVIYAASARDLMAASMEKQAPAPYVYEEQTLILSDNNGRYSVRTMKHYERRDESGERILTVVVTPRESTGMSVFVVREPGVGIRRGSKAASSVLGSDFLVGDLELEQIDAHRYEALPSQEIDHVKHHVLRAIPIDDVKSNRTSATDRVIYLREDNLFVSRIDFRDEAGRTLRRQSFRDPRPDATGAWRPGMILMENFKTEHRSVLKIDRRVHSADYVPPVIFAGLS
jgi:Outer membrane lipoprotein-sorting protein